MSTQALMDYTFTAKYANYLPDKKRRETWDEAVTRVKEMHLRKYPQAREEIDWAFDMFRQKKVLGSQRALQFGGSAIERANQRLFNCSYSHCDRLRFFQEAFYLLLSGCGVGFSVQFHHVAKLPLFHQKTGKSISKHIVGDSIEGWANALGVLLESYADRNSPHFSTQVEFDYSRVRPKGSRISSCSGKAPGPEPLKKAIELIDLMLKVRPTSPLRPIEAYDIVMHASNAVLSGGIRRAATIALFSPEDEEMATAKTGDWFYKNPQRARSNNSALVVRSELTRDQFKKLMRSVKEFGEPGFIFADDKETGFNPCSEISLVGYNRNGESGFDFCNLSTINGKLIQTPEDFFLAAKAASIIGTLQAGYTHFPYMGRVTEEIAKEEALLGVSITGIMENPVVLLEPKYQQEASRIVVETNRDFSKKIGINQAARTTCCKPEGSSSAMLGTSSGIHPHHSKRYFRNVQGNDTEITIQHFAKQNPEACQSSVWSGNGKDKVISFCVETQEGSVMKNEMSAIDLLEAVKSTQKNWVLPGTNLDLCVNKNLRHNVSNTINVRDHEWDEVEEFIFNNRDSFAGISLLPSTGDLDYPQAPFTRVLTAKELVDEYGEGSILASGLIVDGLHAFGDLWRACDAVKGMVDAVTDSQQDWVRRAKKFADNFFNGVIQTTLYCLKDVSNFHRWCRLKKLWKEVDYSTMIEEDGSNDFTGELACAGGTCEIL